MLATAETIAIMRQRYGAEAGGSLQALGYGETLSLGEVRLRFVPAGHVLGSAQVVIDYRGSRVVVSGDYKRRPDPTCAAFEPQRCDLFITEATFGLPVFRHPPDTPRDRQAACIRCGCFPSAATSSGSMRSANASGSSRCCAPAGYDEPIYLHGALLGLTELYRECRDRTRAGAAVDRGAARRVQGQIVLAPPGALADRWTRRLPDPVAALASGWMRVKQRAKARGVELPLVISDHADWDELTATIDDVGASEIWVTHGREEALVHYAQSRGLAARALALTGFGEEEE